MRPLIRHRLLGSCALGLLLSACLADGARGNAACGIAFVAGPTALLDQFSIPRRTLSVPPRTVPERLVVRLAAGPAFPALVGRVDSTLVVGIDAPLPPNAAPQFGVLIADPTGVALGVMLFETPPVQGAPLLGTVAVGGAALPLLGLESDLARLELKGCSFFPDSVLAR